MLKLVTDSGEFDLFGDETIVQTLSMFNLSDLTSRGGEYSNVFNLPLTNNNRRLIEYADFIPSINTTPYKKISCKLVIDGLEFKNAFIVIESIRDTIKARVFSGNSNFYDLCKNTNLTNLDWSAYDHVWNYTNAVASSANTSGYTYPLINYNGQTLGGDILDIRKVLPATFNRTILDLIVSELGYTSIINFDDTDFNKSILPYSKANPVYSAAYLLLNSVDLANAANQSPSIPSVSKAISGGGFIGPSNAYPDIFYSNVVTVGSSSYFDLINSSYNCNQSGNYDVSIFFDMSTFSYMTVSFSNIIPIGTPAPTPSAQLDTYIEFVKIDGGGDTVLYSELVTTGSTVSSTVALNQGDIFYVRMMVRYVSAVTFVGGSLVMTLDFNPVVLNTTALAIDLSPELVFNGLITYSSMLPSIKCSEFLKDIFIRFGIISTINEATKVVTFDYFDKIKENIPNAIEWGDKLDESELPDNSFAYDSYAQNNIIKHKEDKSVVSNSIYESYNLLINNQNLELNKTIYTSPFSQSENDNFNGTITAYIDLYDTASSKFSKGVNYRILFVEPVVGLFKFTDGTTTSGYINVNRCYFVDLEVPDLCMGFGLNLISKNSETLVNTLQNLRIVKANFNLNILDILNLDYFVPIYVEQFQSYFFISSINQYNYTEHDLTEVELIKLN